MAAVVAAAASERRRSASPWGCGRNSYLLVTVAVPLGTGLPSDNLEREVAGSALLGRANQHHVLLFAIVAGHQELGTAHAFLARTDIANDAVERHRAAHAAAVEIPNF